MQQKDHTQMYSTSDHFYTTEMKDFKSVGYKFEGITGYLYSYQSVNTIGLHHFVSHVTHDNFYTHQTEINGYLNVGVVGYMYPEAVDGTVPLLRWWHPDVSNHFYCTDPKGELAPALGYTFEGITGYIHPNPVRGTKPLFRWYHP
ncbi:hypothetical protein BGX27_010208 [Mortierella sp. AM989]|nr:hypothetical protein BGX27_010208 [Mortierella sp. AM989]